MNLTLSEIRVRNRGTARFRLAVGPGRRPPEPLFDPALPLPRVAHSSPAFPCFLQLYGIVPPPYINNILTAYARMANLAAAALPTMLGLVHTEPFFEWLMHTDLHAGRYRDHLAHQLRVATIGDLLLDERIGGQSLLQRACASPSLAARLAPLTAHPERFVRLAWWIAGLFHDCMYPYEFHRRQFVRLGKVIHLPLTDPTHAVWFDALRTVAEHVGILTSEDILRCAEAHHQFSGAAQLLVQNSSYERSINMGGLPGEDPLIRERRRLLLSLAAEAVMTHHQLRVAGRLVSFDDNPLGFVLILSDEVHEAGRPLAQLTASSTKPRTSVFFHAGEIQSVHVRTNTATPPDLEVTFNCRHSVRRIARLPRAQWCAKKQRELDKLRCGPHEVFGSVNVRVVP